MELYEQKELVKEILNDSAEARDDDFVLYVAFVERQYGAKLNRMNVLDLFERIRKGEYPSIESIGRARRKAQEENPELKGSKNARQRREKAEMNYHSFYGHDFS